MNIDWVQLLVGIAALVAASIWPSLVGLNPPFDEATFVNIFVWLVELLLGGTGIYKIATLKFKK